MSGPELRSGRKASPKRALWTRRTPAKDRATGENDFMNGVQGQGSGYERIDRNDRMAAVPRGEMGVTPSNPRMSRLG